MADAMMTGGAFVQGYGDPIQGPELPHLEQLARKLDLEAEKCDEAAQRVSGRHHRRQLRIEAKGKREMAQEARAGLNPYRRLDILL